MSKSFKEGVRSSRHLFKEQQMNPLSSGQVRLCFCQSAAVELTKNSVVVRLTHIMFEVSTKRHIACINRRTIQDTAMADVVRTDGIESLMCVSPTIQSMALCQIECIISPILPRCFPSNNSRDFSPAEQCIFNQNVIQRHILINENLIGYFDRVHHYRLLMDI